MPSTPRLRRGCRLPLDPPAARGLGLEAAVAPRLALRPCLPPLAPRLGLPPRRPARGAGQAARAAGAARRRQPADAAAGAAGRRVAAGGGVGGRQLARLLARVGRPAERPAHARPLPEPVRTLCPRLFPEPSRASLHAGLSSNRLASLPDGLCDCAALVHLLLDDNQLASLPARLHALAACEALPSHRQWPRQRPRQRPRDGLEIEGRSSASPPTGSRRRRPPCRRACAASGSTRAARSARRSRGREATLFAPQAKLEPTHAGAPLAALPCRALAARQPLRKGGRGRGRGRGSGRGSGRGAC